ncbi:MAG TPA: GGDEF domain-containing protein, partial [Burkholderiaceae bacterium]
MQFDINTLFGLLLIQLLMLALLLPVLMGWRVSGAARWVQAAALLQSLGWLGFLVSDRWPGPLVDTLSLVLMSAGFSALWWALQSWLGPRPGRWPMIVAAPVVGGIYLALYGHAGWRVGWANAALAIQLL